MKKHTLYITCIAVVISLCVVFALFSYVFIDSSQLSSPPTVEEAEKYFKKNSEDLDIVVDFLLNQEDDVVIVRYAHRWENWKDTALTKEVRRAIKRLRNSQYKIRVTKDENKIDITIWAPAISEMSSGFVYCINGEESPDLQYVTTLEPLSEPGWYFYIEDFNTWRETKREQGDILREP